MAKGHAPPVVVAGVRIVSREVPVTIRVPQEMKTEIEAVAKRLGISQSAVWKILVYRNLRPGLERGIEEAVRHAAEGGE